MMKTFQIAESSLIKTVVTTEGLKFESRNEVAECGISVGAQVFKNRSREDLERFL